MPPPVNPTPPTGPWTDLAILKQDALGRVVLLAGPDGARAVRRDACGGRIPGSALIARLLLRRERHALSRLRGLAGVPTLLATGPGWLVRSFLDGVPLSRAERLPRNFFALLAGLCAQLHERGVAHNDLHKEQNVLVGPDGRPAVVDFQLASVHRKGRRLAARAQEDLRHVEKHARRYEARGGKVAGEGVRRASFAARAWRQIVKPVYNTITRKWLRCGDGEERRPAQGPWPEWVEEVGRKG